MKSLNNLALSPRIIRLWVAAFFALGLLLILNHAMWQDEWQAWLLAQDSRSLTDLFHNLRYEGHPALWYLPLFLFSHLTAPPLTMQLLHLALATATVWVFLRFSPFTRLQKILFIFGYFPFFEYAVISRNYAAGVLLLFTYCAVFPRNFPGKYLVLAGLLFLLCQTSIYGLLMALALGAALLAGEFGDLARSNKLVTLSAAKGLDSSPPLAAQNDRKGDMIFGPNNNRLNLFKSKYQLLAAAAILVAGVCLAILQLLPPPDSGFAVGWRFNLDWPAVLRTLGTIWESYVPVPLFQVDFWETNLISNPYLKFFFSLLLLGFSFFLFRLQPAALTLLALGTLAILSFTYTKYFGSLRHHGHLFLLFLAAAWLSSYYPVRPGKPGFVNRISDFCRRHRQGFISALLTAQLVAGLMAAGLGLYYPFSAGKETAGYIEANGLGHLPIAGDEDDAASVISGYLQRPIYYLCANRWGSFVIWDQQRRHLEVPEALNRARDLAAKYRQEILLVMNREIKTPAPDLIMLRRFTRSMVPAEAYYLYRLTWRRTRPGPGLP